MSDKQYIINEGELRELIEAYFSLTTYALKRGVDVYELIQECHVNDNHIDEYISNKTEYKA